MQQRLMLMLFVATLFLVAITPLSVCLLCAAFLTLNLLQPDVAQIRLRPVLAAARSLHTRLQLVQSPRPPPLA
ncbi:MAG: hypothetical protein ABJF23_30610 [Bryobacteraceae bacterium]